MIYIVTLIIISILIPGIIGIYTVRARLSIYTIVILLLSYASVMNLIAYTLEREGYNRAMDKVDQAASDIMHGHDQCKECMNDLIFRLFVDVDE